MGIQFPPIAFLYLLYFYLFIFLLYYVIVQWYKVLLNLNLNSYPGTAQLASVVTKF